LHAGGQVGGELNAAVKVLSQQIGEVIFVDWDTSFLELADLGFVVVDTDNVVADFGEADCGDEADIP
jgi:hypothetical protein